jgi:hypothetical protein
MRAVEGHMHAVPFYLTSDMFGDLGCEVAGGEISQLIGKPVAEPHKHDRDEVYLLLSPSPGGAVIDVEIDGICTRHASPASIHVPAGSLHRFVTVEAERGSYCLGIFVESRGARPLHQGGV